MAESVDPRVLAERCRLGDEDACRQLFDCYVERLVALARRRISQRLASRVDPEDIVQSVFRTFFGRLKAGRFRLEEQDDLCKLLMRSTSLPSADRRPRYSATGISMFGNLHDEVRSCICAYILVYTNERNP